MKRQQLKAQNTKNNIMAAAEALFIERGYAEVSVAEIVEKAGCSVGAFYGHFKSKEVLVTKIWVRSVTSAISETVEKGSRISDRLEFVDYLIKRSNETRENPVSALYKNCVMTHEDSVEVASYASRYTALIKNVLRAYAPDASEDNLWGYASIIHSVLNAHAIQDTSTQEYLNLSRTLRGAILALMDACRETDDQSKI